MPLTQASSPSLTKEVVEHIAALLLIADPADRSMHFLQQWPVKTFNLPSRQLSYVDFFTLFHLAEAEAEKYFQQHPETAPPFFCHLNLSIAGQPEKQYGCEAKPSGNWWVLTLTEPAVTDQQPVVSKATVADDFAYVASHDMQEPVRKLSTYVERLIEKLPEEQRQSVSPYTDRIIKSAGHLRAMIDGLLEFSRVGKENHMEEVSLERVVAASIQENQKMQQETGAEIHVDALPLVAGNFNELRQMFSHLIDNALKFNETTPVVHIFEKKVAEQLPVQHPAYCCIVVQDNGIGFKQEYGEKIFEMFRRIHPKIKYTGNGLGLAICRKIIDHHGGRITAFGKEGEGTEIHIFLPVKPAGHAKD